MLSQIYSLYDLLGLLPPIMIKYKLILQKMEVDCLEWDEELSSNLLIASQDILIKMLKAGEISFPCGVMPEGADLTNIGLVGFLDCRDPTSAACLYVRMRRMEPGDNGKSHTVRLLAAKARVTSSLSKESKLRASTLRSDLQGMLYVM